MNNLCKAYVLILFLGDHFQDMADTTGSAVNWCPSVRIIIQQCLSARLQVQPPTETEDERWVEVKMTTCKLVLMISVEL